MDSSMAVAGGRDVAVLLAVLLIVLTVGAFWPTLTNGLTNWDDDVNISGNPHIRSLSAANLRWMFLSHLQGHYQPLTWLSYAVDVRLWGGTARGYHVTNLLLHVATVLGFYMLTNQLLRRSLSEAAAHASAGWIAAAIGAAVFAVHPLRVESVAWATERRDVLSGLFFVLTLSLYVRAHAPETHRAAPRIVAALIVYAMALLSKVMVVSLPVVLIVLDWYPLGRMRRGAWGVWLEKIPFFLMGLAASAMAVVAQSGASAMLPFDAYGPVDRLRQAIVSVGFYVYRTLLPVNLSTLHELRGPIPWTDAAFVASLIFVAGATAALIVWRRRVPALLAAFIAYCVILVPVSGLLQNGPQIVADRYSYLSCMGFAMLIGGAWLMIGRWRHLITPIACVAIMALAAMTYGLSQSWRDSTRLWRRVVRLDPASCLGRLNLAKSLADLGRHEEALRLYEAVIHDRPNQERTYVAYANSLLALGRFSDAVREYRGALRLRPDDADALNNMGNALWQAGDIQQAAAAFEDAIRIRPGYANAHFNLGRLLLTQGQDEAGRAQLRAALDARPTFAEARIQLALSLADAGRFAEAIKLLETGLALAPNDSRIAGGLALFLATCPDEGLRNGARALALAQQVINSGGSRDPVAYGTLAAAYAEVGRFDDAVSAADDAMRIANDLGDVALAEEIREQRDRYAARKRYSVRTRVR